MSVAGNLNKMNASSGSSSWPKRVGQCFRQMGPLGWAILIVGFAVPMTVAMYTQNAWEDYYITFRHSMNLVKGNGLVYQPGERVHGFTSPIGTLLPALLYALTLGRSDEAALFMFRVVSSITLGVATLLFFVVVARWQWSPANDDPAKRLAGGTLLQRYGGWGLAGGVLAAMLMLTDMKSVVFSINGMETAYLLLFLTLSMYFVFVRDPRECGVQIGLAFAGLQWTRPDGVIYMGAVLVALFVFSPVRRLELIKPLAKGALVFTLVYAPWVIATKLYYGSPIPHTVIAKNASTNKLEDLLTPAYWDLTLNHMWSQGSKFFGPIYQFGIWPRWMGTVWKWLPILAGFLWLFPSLPRLSKQASLSFLLMCGYFTVPKFMFPWYAPPPAMLGYTAMLVAALWLMKETHLRFKLVGVAGLTVMLLSNVVLLVGTARMLKVQQEIIEQGTRKVIGMYLREHAKRSDTVLLECLGYIGYYSECHMYDIPGLCAPKVAELSRQHMGFGPIAMQLKPDWVVCRPTEERDLKQQPGFDQDYVKVKRWDRSKELDQYEGELYGLSYARYDQVFTLYRKKTTATTNPN